LVNLDGVKRLAIELVNLIGIHRLTTEFV